MSASLVSSKRPSRRKLAVCVAAVFALGGTAAHANDWPVSNCKDDGSVGSMRWATAAASTDTVTINISDNSACIHNVSGVTETVLVGSALSFGTGVTINGPGRTAFAVSALGSGTRAITSSGTIHINDMTVKYASITGNGACIEATSDIYLDGVGLTACYAYSPTTTARGGAVQSFLGSVNIQNSSITKSTATTASTTTSNVAAGGAVSAYQNVYISGSTISGTVGAYVIGAGTASARGGAIEAKYGTTVVANNSLISYTTASVSNAAGGSANGGAIWSKGRVDVNTGSSIYHTSATTQSNKASLGGGVYSQGDVVVGGWTIANGGSPAAVWHSSAYSKTGSARGGGVYSKGETQAKYAYITSNSASGPSSRAGGVYSSSGFYSKYSYFWANSSHSGGAIIVPSGNSTIRGTTVVNNHGTTGYSGLDLWAGGASNVTIEQSTIAHNTSGNGSSDALYVRAYSTKLYNNTIAYNSSGSSALPAVRVKAGNAGSTLTIASNLMSGNTYNTGTKNDLSTTGTVTISGDHNLIRNPGVGVPAGTVVGQCPLLYPGRWQHWNLQWQYVMRIEVKSPATDAGSNPKNFGADQRGGATGATSPARASSQPSVVTPLPDIGAYEIDQSDEIFDHRFEGCT